jgi:hypothetical protein
MTTGENILCNKWLSVNEDLAYEKILYEGSSESEISGSHSSEYDYDCLLRCCAV